MVPSEALAAPLTVIVTVDAAPDVLQAVVAHARAGLERFPDYPGFIDGALHLSEDGGRVVQLLRWQSDAEYEICMEDPAWDDEPTRAPFVDAVSRGATLEVRRFRVVASSG